AGGATQLGMGQDEGELPDAVGGERGGVEVLDDEDAVPQVEDLRHFEWPRRILGRSRAVAPRVAAGRGHPVSCEPVRDLATGTGLPREIGLGIVPVRTPARMEEHRVARLRLEALEIVDGDDLPRAELLVRDVDEPAAGDDLRNRLGTELLEAA